MGNKTFKMILTMGIIFIMLFQNFITVAAEETDSSSLTDEEQTSVSTFELEAVKQSVIMLKDVKTAKIPIYMTQGVTISAIRTSQSNFKAEYDNGVIIVTAFNTDDYLNHCDVQLTLYIEGNDPYLISFTKEIQIMLEMETKESISEELNKEKPIDISMMSAYNRTLYLNAIDRRKIALSNRDFSDCKIACIGDSITEGVGINNNEEILYSYPANLKHILGAEEVINLGKGGTSISSYWDSFLPMTEGIPEDTDIIIVLGGVNDCYSGNKDNMGNLENLEPGTFYGDTNFLMQDLKKRYPDSMILFVTPISTVTNTTYLSFLPNMLPISVYAEVIKELGEENDIPVFDVYSEEFLDSHDEEIMNRFMYDGVHPNVDGYYILAEHIAAKLIEMEADNED